MKYQMSLPKVGLRSKVKAVVRFQRTRRRGAASPMYEIIAPHAAAALGAQFLDDLFCHGKGINGRHMVALPPKVGRFHHKVQCRVLLSTDFIILNLEWVGIQSKTCFCDSGSC
jgi:hypothetical protein